MNDLSKPANRRIVESGRVVQPGLGGKMRLIAGLGISAMGAGVLLADGFRFLGLPL